MAWPAIARGEHVLLSAPTGSGKTLAAFLWALDRLVAEPRADAGTRVLYISPLKALAYDIERNLRAPLRGIGAAEVSVGIRTGDTPQRERAAMARRPPEILITTPESAYLLLTSKARTMLDGLEAVIVDEIHALAPVKRGAHLALTLERITARVAAAGGAGPQRIGLSATQRPLAEVARFLAGPRRPVTVLDAAHAPDLDLRIEVPVESMAQPAADEGVSVEPVQGGENTLGSIWPAIYPELLEQVRGHRSTIVFVNSRRTAERVALRLNELAEQPIARAHHGSLSREERGEIEEQLKGGTLPCLVATSSLELGIDMGAVDLVMQIASPGSVSRGLQRVGRAGHAVGETSRGIIFPRYRGDLLECAVLARRMREAQIESTVVPRNALDVLAQHIVSAAVERDEEGERPLTVQELHEIVCGSYSYGELSRELLENVLDMLDGRYPSSEFGELRARVAWDRIEGTVRARRGARQLAITNAGTIPDRGLFAVTLPDGRRVGEFDEEMVHEARVGQTFLLGASSWRIEEIGRDRVIVTPAPGVPGAVPFWRGDTLGRPRELGQAIGEFCREALELPLEQLQREYHLEPRAARNLTEYLAAQQSATRVIPSDRTIVLERFRDEIGDWRLCVLSPYGGRVHAAWGLAVSARLRELLGLEADALWSDDGLVLRLPELDADDERALPSAAELLMLEPDELDRLIAAELADSALFGARFRENAARALLIPRAYPGRRTPLWQQRLKAQNLLEVARRYPDFPIVLETMRECLRDVLDVGGLRELLAAMHRREIGLVEVESEHPSPFASSLLFDYVATYMYEDDVPTAERRAAALTLDRDLLRELLGQDELRELIDPGALERVELELQRMTDELRAVGRDTLLDTLRALGDLDEQEIADRVLAGVDAGALIAGLAEERRAVRVRIAGEQRWIAADEAGLYRDALGVVPPGGLPESFLAPVEEPLRELVARFARTRGPFAARELQARFGVDCSALLRELERAGRLVLGELRPGGSDRDWCDVDVLRRLRRASLAALRREIEPVDAGRLGAFLPAWQGVDRHPRAGAGIDRLREVLVALQGLALPAAAWERDVLPRRVGAWSPAWLDMLCASGELVWCGAGAHGRSGRVALYFREDAALLGPPARADEAPGSELHTVLRERLAAAPAFFSDLVADVEAAPEQLARAVWDLVWSGEATNDAWAPLRAGRLTLAAGSGRAGRRANRSRFAAGRRGAPTQTQGRWSLTAPLFSPAEGAGERRRALAELLLERYGVVTREQVLAEGVRGGFALLYDSFGALETLGLCRRGYFIEGMGGAQFALPGAVERLRAAAPAQAAAPLVLAAVDPAQPYGACLPWPRAGDGAGRPARTDGAYVVLEQAGGLLYVERGGRSIVRLAGAAADEAAFLRGLEALAGAVRAGRVPKLALERIDGEPALSSPVRDLLVELGFRAGPRRLTLTA